MTARGEADAARAPAPGGRLRAAAERSYASNAPLVLVAAVAAVGALAVGAQLVAYRWEDLVGSEFTNVFHAGQLGSGDALYRGWGAGSWSFAVYLPGFYLLLAPLTWIAGTSHIWLERLASLVALIGIAWLAGLTASRLGASRRLSLASGLAVFTFTPVTVLAGVVRPDVFGVLFAAWGLYVLTRWENEGGTGRIVLVGVLCVAVLITRESYAAVPIALVVSVLLRNRRLGLALGAGILVATVAVLGITDLLSHGAFLDDQRAYTAYFSLHALSDVLRVNILPYPNPIYVLGLIGVAVGLGRGKGLRAAHLAWVGGAVSGLAAVKVGSSGNYLLPLMWASCVLVGPVLQALSDASGPRIAAAAGAALALLLLPQAVDTVRQAWRFHDAVAPLETASAAAVGRMDGVRGPILGDRFDLLQAAGRTPNFEPVNIAQMEVTGKYTPTDLVRAIRGHRFALVESSIDLKGPVQTYQGLPLWPPSVARAVATHYCQSWHLANSWLYRPCQPR